MFPDERRWIINELERFGIMAARAEERDADFQAIVPMLTDIRRRLDALESDRERHAGWPLAETPRLANPDFITNSHATFDYRRVLASVAVWDTAQERLADCSRYDEWFRRFGRGVSIVIPSYEDHVLLRKCLLSLQRARETYNSVRVIIADDASPSREHQAYLDQLEAVGVIVVRNEVNGGFARNVNSALAFIGDEDFVLLNSDTEPEGYWLEALQYGCYASSSGIAGAKLLYPDRRIQHAGICRNPGDPLWFDHYYRGQSEFFGPACVPGYQVAVTGACLYVTNRTFRKIGALDPEFGMAFEDVDYCLRAWQAGERVLYYPYARIVHHESAVRGLVQGSRELASRTYFWEKWGEFLDARPLARGGKDATPDIVYVLEDTGIAGGHRNVFEHVNLLIDAGFRVELWSLAKHPDWFELKTQTRSFATFAELTAALAPLRSVKVATWWNTAETVWLASRLHGHPAYLVSDIEASYYVDDPFMRARVIASYKFDFSYMTISKWGQEQLARLGIRSSVVSCSVDLETFRPLAAPKRANVLLAPGRRNHLKNFQLTLRAWANLGDDRPELWMYGGEPDIADFLEPVRYFHKPSDLYLNRLINEATAFALTSRHEGFALTILEAMAAGTPVITTDCHGNRDFCRDGVNCLLVADGDLAGVTNAMRRVLADADLRRQLAAEGLKTANRFSRSAMQQQLIGFFSKFPGMRPIPVASAAA